MKTLWVTYWNRQPWTKKQWTFRPCNTECNNKKAPPNGSALTWAQQGSNSILYLTDNQFHQGAQIDENGPYLSACVLGILKGSLDLWEEDLPIEDSDLAINIVLADLCGLVGSLYIGIGAEVFFGGADMTSSDISAIVAGSIVSGIFSSATGGFGLLGKLMIWP